MIPATRVDDADFVEPAWFTAACARARTQGEVDVGGTSIRYYQWEPVTPSTIPPLILLHGTAANAEWWTHVAGLLAADRRVATFDLSGHGDSAHRSNYGLELWADELLAVARAVDEGAGVSIFGYSLGALVAMVAAARVPDLRLHGVALCELVRDPRAPYDETMPSRPRQFHPNRDDAVARFRLIPSQARTQSFIVDRIAQHSVTEYPDGWTWKYDTDMVNELTRGMPVADDLLPSITCPLTLVRSELGVVTRSDFEAMATIAGPRAASFELPATGHHPMLDEPLLLVAVIRALTSGWEAAATRPAS